MPKLTVPRAAAWSRRPRARLTRCVSAAPSLLFALCLLVAAGCGDDGAAADADAGGGDGGGGGGGGGDTGGGGDAGGGGPREPLPAMAELIDLEALYLTDNLGFTLEDDRSGRVPGDFDEPVWQIGVSYESITFAGQVWSHSATLILPDTLPAGRTAAAIVPRSTPNPVDQVSDSVAYLTQYAALTADRLNIPVLVVDVLPTSVDLRGDSVLSALSAQEPRCFASALSDQALITDCLWRLSQRIDAPEYFPAVPVAASWVRAVTMLQYLRELVPGFALEFDVPDFEVSDVVVLGGGLAGIAARYAMAMDHRIAGVMAASADIGAFGEFFELMGQSWAGDYSFDEPDAQEAFWSSAEGRDFAALFDWPALAESIGDRPYFAVIGTNDPRYPLGAYEQYADALAGDSYVMYAQGYGAGFGTLDHLLTWRAFLAHVIDDRPLPSVDIALANEGGNLVVTATVETDTLINGVTAAFVQRQDGTDDQDLRDGLWRTAALAETAPGVYSGAIAPLGTFGAVFVRVADSQGLFEGVVTSPVLRIP